MAWQKQVLPLALNDFLHRTVRLLGVGCGRQVLLYWECAGLFYSYFTILYCLPGADGPIGHEMETRPGLGIGRAFSALGQKSIALFAQSG